MTFQIDSRLLSSSIYLCEWELSNVYLKNESAFPWFVLVPRVKQVQELYQLTDSQQQKLMKEITLLSTVLADEYTPDKLNVGSLGNIVSQLHIHVIGRYKTDPCWPHSIWQAAYQQAPYSKLEIEALAEKFSHRLAFLQQPVP